MDLELIDLFAASAVISAVQQTGLLHALVRSGPQTAQAHAEKLGLDPRATRLVLDALVTLELAERVEPDLYDTSARMKTFGRSFGLIGGAGENLWGHAPAFLRTGQPFVRMDGTPAERETSYQDTVAWLGKMFEGTARELASKLKDAPARVLDVGCGSGVWSLAIAERFPSTRVTGQDLPAVLETFTGRAKSMGLGDRVATIPGDMHAVELPPGGFDLVMICNVVRLEPPERAAALLGRLAKAVAPGGALMVVDALAGGTPERERARTLYALNLALRTKDGRVHSPAEITAWLKAAGFGSVETVDVGDHATAPGAIGALLARR
jgi:ubiquinone/menaquinone biosynthesis C-methylase UbiE